MRLSLLGVMAGLAALIGGVAHASALQQGERAFQKCYACHSIEEAETGLSGSNLRGIVCRPIAADSTFDYSLALRKLARQERRWTPDLLDRLIASPEEVAPGTDMTFVGLPDAQERRHLIAFLARTGVPAGAVSSDPAGNCEDD